MSDLNFGTTEQMRTGMSLEEVIVHVTVVRKIARIF